MSYLYEMLVRGNAAGLAGAHQVRAVDVVDQVSGQTRTTIFDPTPLDLADVGALLGTEFATLANDNAAIKAARDTAMAERDAAVQAKAAAETAAASAATTAAARIADLEAQIAALTAPPAVARTYKSDIWQRATDDEAEIILAGLNAQPLRLRRMFDDAPYLAHDNEQFSALQGAFVAAFGEARAAELLAPSA